jgi:hypothetical protein
MNKFGKKSTEQYPIAWEFKGLLPPGSTIVSGTAAAIDTADNSDQSAVVLSGGVTVSGTEATMTVRAGSNGHIYKLTMTTSLSPSGSLSDDILMVVGD